MLSILERMNPAECLGGRLSLVYDNYSKDENKNIRATTLDSTDFQQLIDNDGEELEDRDNSNNAIILKSLRRTVPDLLECIISSSSSNINNTAATTAVQEKENRGSSSYSCCTSALQTLHDLTTKECEQNRVPLVCNNEQWDVVGVLSSALLASAVTTEDEGVVKDTNTLKKLRGGKLTVDEDRRLMLWTLNNLSIPYENKASMAMGKSSSKLLQALTRIIELNLPESYLCCICLLNLTFYANVIRNVTLYVPPPPTQTLNNQTRFARSQTVSCGSPKTKSPTNTISTVHHARVRSLDMSGRPVRSGTKTFSFGLNAEGRDGEISNALGNSSSLIRVVEKMMVAYTPFLLTSVRSVQGEAIRWSCGFIRNVTYVGSGVGTEGNIGMVDNHCLCNNRPGEATNEPTSETICLLLSQTEIPRLVMQYVKDSTHPIIEWTKDSLEDMCLGAMCNMAQWQSTREALWRAGTFQSLKKLEECPGIHGYRARAIRCSLGALQLRFR